MIRKLNKLIKYQLHLYFKGSGFVMPFVVIVAFLYLICSSKPIDIVSLYLMSGVFVFLSMVWIGISEVQREDEVMERIMLLRVDSAGIYYMGKAGFLLCVGLIVNLICVLFPIIQSFISGGLFTRELTVYDAANAFILQGGCAVSGAALGSLFHPRIIRDKKISIILTLFITVISVAKTALVSSIPVLKAVLWLLPPIMMPSQKYADMKYFDIRITLQIFVIMTAFGGIYFIIKSILCHRNKFL